MTPAELCDLVKRLSYKPTVTFEATVEPWGAMIVMHLAGLVDANDPTSTGNSLRFGIATPAEMLSYFNEARAIAWLRDRIHEWERHEADEWIRIDGKKLFCPHGGEVIPFEKTAT